MRKILLFFLFVTAFCNGQIVNIPDAGFKFNLSQIGVDANGDGNIQVSEAQAVTELTLLYITAANITDFTGLEAFTNLQTFNCANWSSSVTELDVSVLPSLVTLNCSHNELTSLNITGLAHLETVICENNLLTSLDLSGCTSLKSIQMRHNHVTALDLSQTPGLETLKAEMNALTSVNFNAAPTLKNIDCNYNQLTAVDVSGLPQLESLSTYSNDIASINFGTIGNLKHLVCGSNELATLDLSQLTLLEYLECDQNQLTSLNTTPLANITALYCRGNQLTALDVSAMSQMTHLDCGDNQITSLNLANLSALSIFSCDQNQLTALDVSGLANVSSLNCYSNNIPSLNVAGLNQLGILVCAENPITALDVSAVPSLISLHCGGENFNSLTLNNLSLRSLFISDFSASSFDFSSAPNLRSLGLDQCVLTDVDVSMLDELDVLEASNCTDLTFVNTKNGNHWWDTMSLTENCPNLEYICAEDYNIDFFAANHPGVQVQSYCSFTPGGIYNTISGTFLFDADGNGCDANDTLMPMVKVKINDGSVEGATFLNAQSSYNFFTGAGNFALTPIVANPSYFNFEAIPVVNFAQSGNQAAVRNICMTPNGIHPEASVVIAPITQARPGFDAKYKVIYTNNGNQLLDGSISIVFDDARTDFISASQSGTQIGNTLAFNFTDLIPFETRTIEFTINLNGPMETPPLNNSDVLDFTANMTYPIEGVDYTTSFALHHTVVNSFDPNDKTCLEGETISPQMIGDYVHYNINFENLGTAEATNVVVKDMIDTSKFDISTLQLVYASHPVVARVRGNVVEFIFENINLPGTTGQNKGNIVFKIKTWPTLVLGNSISNKAEIFFDYNFPIETNEATSTFSLLKNDAFKMDATIGIAPNPAKDKINIKANSMIKSLQLFDIQGRLLQVSTENKAEVSLDLSGKQNGIYFLKVISEKGSKVEKLIKE